MRYHNYEKWTSLALLGLTSASLLVACGSKKEENKSSTKEAQTTVKSSQKKAKAASGKKETKATETDSQEGAQAASQDATNSGQTDAGSSSVSTNKATDSSQMVPEELVGTWTGTTEIAKDVQMTVAVDGTVTTTANFYQADLNPVRTATTKPRQFKPLVMSITGKQTNLALLMPFFQGLLDLGEPI